MRTSPAVSSVPLLVAIAALAIAVTQAAAQCTTTPSAFTPVNSVGWNCSGKTTALNAVCASPCRPGYTSSQSVIRTCKGSNQWSAATGTCNKVCAGLPYVDVPYTSWPAECDSSVTVNGWCSGRCNRPGYTGNPRVRCDGNGWSEVFRGKCVNATTVCRTLPSVILPNSMWPATCLDHAPGMACTATCNKFYTTPNPPTATCGADGNWGIVTGQCQKVCTGKPLYDLPFGTWPDECADSIRVNTFCVGKCNAGYVGTPRIQCGSSVPGLGPGGAWTDRVIGQCSKSTATINSVVCPSPPAQGPANGMWPTACTDRVVGANCTAICNPGYTSKPEPVITCQLDGTWSAVVSGSCQKVCTGTPRADLLTLGTWPASCANTKLGGSCVASCPPPYNGSPEVKCLSTGWDLGMVGSCRNSTTVCANPPDQLITNSKPGMPWPVECADAVPGETCEAICNAGYTASTPTATCQEDGTWSAATTVICKPSPTKCASQPTAAVGNGTWAPNCAGVSIGEECQATCAAGFTGSPRVVCQPSGLWDTVPTDTCKDIDACTDNPCASSGVGSVQCADKGPGLPNTAASRTCTCAVGYFYAEGVGCKDIDACANPANTCSRNAALIALVGQLANASCTDNLATAAANGDNKQGRTCSCGNTGLTYVEGTGCTDVDACTANPCGTGATCTDLAPPALNAANGRTCTCGSGLFYNYTTEACEVVRCAVQPTAGVNGTWAACAGAASGSTCAASCGAGYGGNVTVTCQPTGQWDNVTSGSCSDVDACVTNPCKAPFAACEDKSAAQGFLGDLAGRECKCANAFQGYNETTGCLDLDACAKAPCGPGATCVDATNAPADASGRSCLCANGTFYANDTAGCQDFDSCAGNNPCASDINSNGQCIDLTAPKVGFSCGCKTGFAWNESACLEIDSCTPNPCTTATFPNTDGTCLDQPAPSTSFDCGCSAGFAWNTTSRVCAAIDACVTSACTQSGDAVTQCTDKLGAAGADASGRNCTCPAGYAYTEASGCKNIDACLGNPCSRNTALISQAGALANATCADNPPGSANNGNDAAGRTCSCGNSGLAYTEGTGCADVDACTANPCGTGATCTDLAPPALNAANGRTCACDKAGYGAGYTYNYATEACENVDGCVGNTCAAMPGSSGTCIDTPAPGVGYSCSCLPGYFWNATSLACQDIDACVAFPCLSPAACSDKPAAANDTSGRDCTCAAPGSEYNATTGCVDIDACATTPCGPGATCQDKPGAPGTALGRDCTCGNGTTYAGDLQGCIEFDSCSGNNLCAADSNSNGTCIDKLAPLSGYSCLCKAGFEWSEKAAACTDIDGCAGTNPCLSDTGSTGICRDVAAPNVGHTCDCSTGYFWSAPTVSCTDINACKNNACKDSGAGNVQCTDKGLGFPDNPDGRECRCESGYSYTEASGCQNIDACLAFSCSQNAGLVSTMGVGAQATCADNAPAPPQSGNNTAGRTCSCSVGLTYVEGSGCTDTDGCNNNPCASIAQATICVDAVAPLTGFSCGCAAGFEWKNGQCADIDGCAGSPCSAVVGATGCQDKAAPLLGYECTCQSGRAWNGTACADVNACEGADCGVGNVCVDDPAPGTSYTCSCGPGTVFSAATKRCEDIDGCAGDPCASIDRATAGSCRDVPAPGTGFACTCDAQVTLSGTFPRVWDNTTRACMATACVNNVNHACPDGAWPTCRGTAIGSVCKCVCKEGFDDVTAPKSMCIRRPDAPAYAEWSTPYEFASCQKLTGRKLMSEWRNQSPLQI